MLGYTKRIDLKYLLIFQNDKIHKTMATFMFEDLFLASFNGSIGGILSTTICVLIASFFFDGIKVNGLISAFVAAIVLAIINFFVAKPILEMLPVGGILGILIVNAIVIYIAHFLLEGFKVKSFVAAFILAVVISVLQIVF